MARYTLTINTDAATTAALVAVYGQDVQAALTTYVTNHAASVAVEQAELQAAAFARAKRQEFVAASPSERVLLLQEAKGA